MGMPDPLKIRPNISSETGMRKSSPVNWTVVFFTSIPEVPSNTYPSEYGGSLPGTKGGSYLNDCLLPLNFQDLTESSRAIRQRQVDNLAKTWKLGKQSETGGIAI